MGIISDLIAAVYLAVDAIICLFAKIPLAMVCSVAVVFLIFMLAAKKQEKCKLKAYAWHVHREQFGWDWWIECYGDVNLEANEYLQTF